MKLSRRHALLLGSSLGITTLSGCAQLPYVGPQLTLTLLNFDSTRHFLHVELLRAEGRERSESVILDEEFELPPPNEEAAAFERRKPNIVESHPYIVRAHLNDDQATRNDYRFYPDCTGNDEPPEELYIEVRQEDNSSDPYIRFSQNLCGANSWWF